MRVYHRRMWDELSVERAVSNDELATAAARACGIDRERITVTSDMTSAIGGLVIERRETLGDFALRVGFYGAPPADRIAFHSSLAHALDCKILVEDGEVDPYTARLVTPDGRGVRVNLDPEQLDRDVIVIAGLWTAVETDDAPDPTARPPEPPARKLYRRTRGERLSFTVNEYMVDGSPAAPVDLDAKMRAYTPEVQDAEHALAHQLRELVHRRATPDDLRVVRAASATLRRAFADAASAGMFIDELLRAADFVLEGQWDPEAAVAD